jgi:hypothetical protein
MLWWISDLDMNTSDTTKLTTRKHIYRVISSSNVEIYYFIIKYKITTSLLYICRIMEYLYKPRVKMQDRFRRQAGNRVGFGRVDVFQTHA